MCAKFGSDRTTDGDVYTLGNNQDTHTDKHTLSYIDIDLFLLTLYSCVKYLCLHLPTFFVDLDEDTRVACAAVVLRFREAYYFGCIRLQLSNIQIDDRFAFETVICDFLTTLQKYQYVHLPILKESNKAEMCCFYLIVKTRHW